MTTAHRHDDPYLSTSSTRLYSEDGQPISEDEQIPPPLPRFDPQILAQFEAPGGAVKLRDQLYVERPADGELKAEMVKWGTTTTVRAPRQTGRTSLLVRGIQYAKAQGAKAIFIDFQGLEQHLFETSDQFLQNLAKTICRELRLDETEVERAWQTSQSPQQKLTYFLEDTILPQFAVPVTLVMDEADHLLEKTTFYQDFFGLVRSWHNRRASHPDEWEKFNIVMAISTEPYLLIDDINQSPFNVGLRLALEDFTDEQVRWLNHQHDSPVTPPDIPYLTAFFGGHPYLTRLGLYEMVKRGWDWATLCKDAIADHGPFIDHLRHQYALIQDQPVLKNALKQIMVSGKCADGEARFRLLRAGLIEPFNNRYLCRCTLYLNYFRRRL